MASERLRLIAPLPSASLHREPKEPRISPYGTRRRYAYARKHGDYILKLSQHIDALKKENFNIKLKVHFLEERLAQLAPDQIDAALKQNINLKIEVQQRGLEMKKYKKLVLELERELERSQKGRTREKELEERLEEMERELLELKRKRAGVGRVGDELRERHSELEDENASLKNEVEQLRELLEESNAALQDLQDDVGGGSLQGKRQSRLEVRAKDLEAENEELHARLDEHEAVFTQLVDERDELADRIEGLNLQVEDLKGKHEAEVLQRSESRAQMYEDEEERQALENQNNGLRDKLAALQIEFNQKEDELALQIQELQDYIAEHEGEVNTVEARWRQEVEEWQQQVDELRDVSTTCPFSFLSSN